MQKKGSLTITFALISVGIYAQTTAQTALNLWQNFNQQNVVGSAQNQDNADRAVNAIHFKPQKEITSDWDSFNSVWYFHDSVRNSYNSSGNITQKLQYNGGTTIDYKNIYVYDGNGKIISDSSLYNPGNGFINNTLYTYTYDVNGNKTQQIYFNNWNGSSWTSGNKTDYSYDVNNNRIQSVDQSWDGTAWTSISKEINTWSSGVLTTGILQLWDGTAWTNAGKSDYVNVGGQITGLTGFSWTGTSWQSVIKYINMTWYQFNGLLNETSKLYGYIEQVPNGSLWKDTIKINLSYDNFGNQTNYIRQIKPNSVYITTEGFKNLYQYNGNNSIIVDTIQQYNPFAQLYENYKKREYSDFYQYTVTSCIPDQPGSISGNNSVNAGDSETYSIAPIAGATSYNWTLPSGWAGTSTSNVITVVTGTTSGTITVSAVNSCGSSIPTLLTVTQPPPVAFDQDWVWAKSTGAEYDGRAMDIATDALGNAYITGTFGSSTITFGSITLNRVSTGSGTDVFIAKYDANGNALWAKNANILAYVPGSSISIATDLNSNVFISGAFNVASANFGGTQLTHLGSVGQHSIFIVKYDSDGNVLWAKDVDYSGSLWMYDLATDSQGNALITGSFGSGSPLTIGSTSLTPYSNTNPFVAKFDVLGNALWAKGGESATNFGNWSYGVATDASDNVFITGEYVSDVSNPLTFGTHTLPETNSSGRSMYIVKFDSNGNALWVKASASPSSSWSYAAVGFHVTTDVNGNAIVAGSFKSTTVNFGSTVLTNSNTTSNVADMFIVKYDSSGNEVWAKKAGGTGDDEGHKISSDTYGNTYVSGYFQSVLASFGSLTVTKDDSYSSFFFVVKYDDLGNEVWVKDVDNTNAYGGGLMPNGVSADDFGNVYVTGDAYDSDQYDTAVFGNHILIDGGVFIAKLGETQAPSAVENANHTEQNLVVFPNPSNGVFNIKKNSVFKESALKVYTIHGKIIFQSDLFVSEIDLSNQPAGVYLMQLKSGETFINRRIVIQ